MSGVMGVGVEDLERGRCNKLSASCCLALYTHGAAGNQNMCSSSAHDAVKHVLEPLLTFVQVRQKQSMTETSDHGLVIATNFLCIRMLVL